MRPMHSALLLTLTLMLLGGCASTPSGEDNGQRLKQAARTNVQLGIEYMRDGDMEMSLNKFEKALDQDPELASAHGGIAVLYDRLNENEKAERHFRKALRLSPNNSQVQNNYGQFLCKQGEYDKADEQFDAAASNPVYSGRPAALTNAGTCAMQIPDLEMAETYFRNALEINGKFLPALSRMAQLRYDQSNYVGARAYLQRIEELTPLTPELLWLGVRVEDAWGNHEAAARYGLLLKNNFPDAAQTRSLQEWEDERYNR
jgi:type IV pilus assembly protein PilF